MWYNDIYSGACFIPRDRSNTMRNYSKTEDGEGNVTFIFSGSYLAHMQM